MSLAGYTVVYGGSFNPPHVGHQMACLYLLEALVAEAVWLVPSRTHPFGKPLAKFDERVEMCRLLVRPFGSGADVSLVEGSERLSGRTVDTLECLQRTHPDLRFALAIGSDILQETRQWHRWDDIAAMVPVVVVGRGSFGTGPSCPIELPRVSSSDIRALLERGESVEGLVPAPIADYIAEHGLYTA